MVCCCIDRPWHHLIGSEYDGCYIKVNRMKAMSIPAWIKSFPSDILRATSSENAILFYHHWSKWTLLGHDVAVPTNGDAWIRGESSWTDLKSPTGQCRIPFVPHWKPGIYKPLQISDRTDKWQPPTGHLFMFEHAKKANLWEASSTEEKQWSVYLYDRDGVFIKQLRTDGSQQTDVSTSLGFWTMHFESSTVVPVDLCGRGLLDLLKITGPRPATRHSLRSTL